MRSLLAVSIGALAAVFPAGAFAQAPAPQSAVSITAPAQVAPGKSFAVKMKVTLSGPDQAFVTGGFMDWGKRNPATSRSRCPETPAGTFAADTPQSPQPPGIIKTTIHARNTVGRTGNLRFCIWVINATTGEQDSSTSAYIKAIARKKRTSRRAQASAFEGKYKGQTAPARQPVKLRIANRKIHDFAYAAAFRCSDGQTVSWGTRLTAFALARDGTFKASPTPFGTQNDVVTIQGRVKGRRVTGSFNETYTSVLGNTCRSGKVRFSATRPRR